VLAQKRKSFLSSIGRKPGSEECGAFRGAARREKRRKPGSEECGAFLGERREL